ncbi:MAG: hypothetical protein IPJ40_02855 [Saprospirales bacterium]|nr:hypothetical protein [Saprospirales bacterium]
MRKKLLFTLAAVVSFFAICVAQVGLKDQLHAADSIYAAEEFPVAQQAFHQVFEASRKGREWGICQKALYNYADVTYDFGDYQQALDTLLYWTPFLEKQTGIDWFSTSPFIPGPVV